MQNALIHIMINKIKRLITKGYAAVNWNCGLIDVAEKEKTFVDIYTATFRLSERFEFSIKQFLFH